MHPLFLQNAPLPRLCAAKVFVDITIFCHLLIGVHLPEAILLTKCSQLLLRTSNRINVHKNLYRLAVWASSLGVSTRLALAVSGSIIALRWRHGTLYTVCYCADLTLAATCRYLSFWFMRSATFKGLRRLQSCMMRACQRCLIFNWYSKFQSNCWHLFLVSSKCQNHTVKSDRRNGSKAVCGVCGEEQRNALECIGHWSLVTRLWSRTLPSCLSREHRLLDSFLDLSSWPSQATNGRSTGS